MHGLQGDDGRTLVGTNEDWEDLPTRVWILAPHGRVFGRVLFGFVNGWAQGGMNDQGLVMEQAGHRNLLEKVGEADGDPGPPIG